MSNEIMEIKNLPSRSCPCNLQGLCLGSMLCVGVDDPLHVDESVEDLGVAGIFKVVILSSSSYIVLIDCHSQLQEIKSTLVIRKAKWR